MSEKDVCGVSIVSYAVDKSFGVSISNLSTILSHINNVYLFIGAQDIIQFRNNNNLHNYIHPYRRGSSKIKQAIRYGIMQLDLGYRLLSSRKHYSKVIFLWSLLQYS